MSGARGTLNKKHRANSAQIRLNKDLEEVVSGNEAEISFPDPNNIQKFIIRIIPTNGIWRGGKFEFLFDIPDEWPIQRPKVTIVTRVWHPNISEDGPVCLNILRDNYSPVTSINHLIQGLYFLFSEPNPNSPLNTDASIQYLQNRQAFIEKAEDYMKKYCPK